MSKSVKSPAALQNPAVDQSAGRIAARMGIVNRAFIQKFLQPKNFLARQQPQAQKFMVNPPPTMLGVYQRLYQRYQPLPMRVNRRAQRAEKPAWRPLEMTFPAGNGAASPTTPAAIPAAQLPALLGLPGMPAPKPQPIPAGPTMGQIIPRKEDDPDYAPNRAARQPAQPQAKRPTVPANHRLFSRVQEILPGEKHAPTAEPAIHPEPPQARTAVERAAPAQKANQAPAPEPSKPAASHPSGTVQRSLDTTGSTPKGEPAAARPAPATSERSPVIPRSRPTGPPHGPSLPGHAPVSPVPAAETVSKAPLTESAEPSAQSQIKQPKTGALPLLPKQPVRRMVAKAVVQRQVAAAPGPQPVRAAERLRAIPHPPPQNPPDQPAALRQSLSQAPAVTSMIAAESRPVEGPRAQAPGKAEANAPTPHTAAPSPARPVIRAAGRLAAGRLAAERITAGRMAAAHKPLIQRMPQSESHVVVDLPAAAKPAVKPAMPDLSAPTGEPAAAGQAAVAQSQKVPQSSPAASSRQSQRLPRRNQPSAVGSVTPRVAALPSRIAPTERAELRKKGKPVAFRAAPVKRFTRRAQRKTDIQPGLVQRESMPPVKLAGSQPPAGPALVTRPGRMVARPRMVRPAAQSSELPPRVTAGGAQLITPSVSGPVATPLYPESSTPRPAATSSTASPAAFETISLPVASKPARPVAQPKRLENQAEGAEINEPFGSFRSPLPDANRPTGSARLGMGTVRREMEDDSQTSLPEAAPASGLTPESSPSFAPQPSPAAVSPQIASIGTEEDEHTLDFDQIAHQVYPVILRKLRIERERQTGRLR